MADLVRLNTPVVTPDELLAECVPGEPASIVKALRIAAITLHADLEADLEGWPYRQQLAHSRSVWARMHAVALAAVLSAMKHNEIEEAE